MIFTNSVKLLLAASAAMMASNGVSGQTCSSHDLDFNDSGLQRGDYVTNQLKGAYKVGVQVTLRNNKGYAPNGAARIFDTSNPGTNNDNGDPDLGTPNSACGGPGIGAGGAPGQPGENCVGLGNVLIIQEQNLPDPDDNTKGGIMTFDFDGLATVKTMEFLDIEKQDPVTVTAYKIGGGSQSFNVPAGGNNGKSTLNINMSGILKLELDFSGSGAVSDLKYDVCSPNGGGGGDPHFRTFDGTHYSYHGECDMVMARSATFGDNLGLDLHVRTHSMGSWSLISNAALRIGDDILEFANDGSYYINSHAVELPFDMAGRYTVTKDIATIEKTLQDGEKETVERQMIKIDLGNGDYVDMSLWKGMIGVRVNAYLADTEGMLGVHNVAGLVGRTHEAEVDADAMGAHWQVRDTEAVLFREVRLPQYPQVCNPPASTSRRLVEMTKEALDISEKACAGVDDLNRRFCIEDVLLTGDAAAADNYAFGEAF